MKHFSQRVKKFVVGKNNDLIESKTWLWKLTRRSLKQKSAKSGQTVYNLWILAAYSQWLPSNKILQSMLNIILIKARSLNTHCKILSKYWNWLLEMHREL